MNNQINEYVNYIDEFCLQIAEDRKLPVKQVKKDLNNFIQKELEQKLSLKEIIEISLPWFDMYYRRTLEPFGCYINY